ncbi:tetratricopeptide repeat protein [Ferrimonas lipolytica]|uniref:Formate-dependent nitrite reductase complex subunit NrfG n=1 Tax=Ferrimonas lipolytica TaxID=2724191 RepID=A0A6H1UA22_9GAMM|nr:hypothetical protein [Ferrimonas lipolytica]QIZ75479.1 hypothetical protein HER31_00305 [Ferrimonas lipolytica]
MLLIILTAILFVAAAVLGWQHRRIVAADDSALAILPETAVTVVPAIPRSALAVSALAIVVVGLSSTLYLQMGRYHDHFTQSPDRQLDYVLRAELQQLAQDANTSVELQQLAQGYAKVGQYDQAVATMSRLLEYFEPTSLYLGLQAKFSYYRDGRVISVETQQLIDQSLALNPVEPETLLLLANHAYLQQDYALAISHWQALLTAAPVGLDQTPIRRAVANAQAKLAAANL